MTNETRATIAQLTAERDRLRERLDEALYAVTKVPLSNRGGILIAWRRRTMAMINAALSPDEDGVGIDRGGPTK